MPGKFPGSPNAGSERSVISLFSFLLLRTRRPGAARHSETLWGGLGVVERKNREAASEIRRLAEELMALKRSASERARDEGTEVFGNAAEPLLTPPAVAVARVAPVRRSVAPELSDVREREYHRTMLLRFDEDLVELLSDVAKLGGS